MQSANGIKVYQRGQAMVEYAILLILFVTLVMGGMELSITAYHSKKTGDAAEAGANAWSEAVNYSITSNSISQTNQDLLELYRQSLNIDTDTVLADRNDEDGTLISDASCNLLPSDTCPTENIADAIRPKLDINCNSVDTFSNANINLPIEITACDKNKTNHLNGILAIIDDPDINPISTSPPDRVFEPRFPNHPQQDFDEICTSRESENIEKIIQCRQLIDINVDLFDTDSNADGIQDTCNILPGPCPDGNDDLRDIFDTDSNSDGTQDACASPPGPCGDGTTEPTQPDGIDDLDPTFKRLLIRKDLTENSTATPIQNDVINRVGLGDHSPLNFTKPTCNALSATSSAYSNGLPDNTAIYLFNPLPIDLSGCNGNDNFRQGKSRLSILVGGYKDNSNPSLNVEGLPALNQAMYSEYTKVCVTENLGQIRIINFNNCSQNGGVYWLKPPGKMCGAGNNNLNETCPGVGDLNGATGYYLLGRSDQESEDFVPSVPIANANNTFRPTMQIVCGSASHINVLTDPGGQCANSTGSFSLEVNTRYRAVFESFLTFGIQEISNIAYLPYFYNPNKVGIVGNQLLGVTGSEIGPIGNGGNPSIKQFKDFRGCFRVDISPPDKIGEQVKTSVSSCN